MAGVELDQRRGQRAGDQARRGADGQAATGHARQRPRLGARGLDVGQDPLHERQQRAAVGRQGDRSLTRAPVEQHHTQLLFEEAHLARQRGLGQVQSGRGPGEALLLGHGEGVRQLVQLHSSELIALNFMHFMSLTCLRADRRVRPLRRTEAQLGTEEVRVTTTAGSVTGTPVAIGTRGGPDKPTLRKDSWWVEPGVTATMLICLRRLLDLGRLHRPGLLRRRRPEPGPDLALLLPLHRQQLRDRAATRSGRCPSGTTRPRC